ncbi:hypothetical protein [Ruminococcus flavefaciens]|uniref:hypothetical protein n=1 Tax=Ruminococcus flavefaciens TaxID=1265 RepID=UPI0012BB7F16|nr:hypothetical protein [Ruminococcus flavefaciens]
MDFSPNLRAVAGWSFFIFRVEKYDTPHHYCKHSNQNSRCYYGIKPLLPHDAAYFPNEHLFSSRKDQIGKELFPTADPTAPMITYSAVSAALICPTVYPTALSASDIDYIPADIVVYGEYYHYNAISP